MNTFSMPTTGTWEERGGAVVRSLVADLNLTAEQAAGIVGNLGFETSGFTKLQEIRPIVAGSRGGYGWAQWTGSRRLAFEDYARKRGLTVSSDEANYAFLVYELKGTENAFLSRLRRTDTLLDATALAMSAYERPSDQSDAALSRRLGWAQRAFAGAIAAPAPPKPRDTTPPTQDDTGVTRVEDDDAVFRPIIECAVQMLQTLLRQTGDYDDRVDGIWGPNSEKAIEDFQRRVRE